MFAAHSGAQFSETHPDDRRRLHAAARRRGEDHAPAHAASRSCGCRVAAAEGAPGLREVRLLLPDALRAKPKRARRGARAKAGTTKLPRSAIKLTRDGELRVTLPEGTRTLGATLSKGALRVSRKLKRKRKPKRQELRVLVRDSDGSRPPVTLKVRPRRR